MKRFNNILLLGCLMTLPACSFNPQPLRLDQALGPAPRNTDSVPDHGELVVYSAWNLFAFAESEINLHSSYTIMDENGKLLREVQNYRDRFDGEPVHINLAPGSYQVIARSAHSGKVNLPVLIKRGETTVVYLDGSTKPSGSAASAGNFVKLPDGEVAGWPARE